MFIYLLIALIIVLIVSVVIINITNKSSNKEQFSLERLKHSLFGDKSVQQSSATQTVVSNPPQENAELQQKIRAMQNDMNKLQNDIQTLSCKLENLMAFVKSDHGILTDMSTRIGEIEYQANKETYDNQSSVECIKFEQSQRYASMVDCSNPLGFSEQRLSASIDSAVYEIIIKSNTTAEYRLVENGNIHLELMQTFNSGILTAGCEYTNTPDNFRNRIEVISNGQLNLIGAIWCIDVKCKIKFE